MSKFGTRSPIRNFDHSSSNTTFSPPTLLQSLSVTNSNRSSLQTGIEPRRIIWSVGMRFVFISSAHRDDADSRDIAHDEGLARQEQALLEPLTFSRRYRRSIQIQLRQNQHGSLPLLVRRSNQGSSTTEQPLDSTTLYSRIPSSIDA